MHIFLYSCKYFLYSCIYFFLYSCIYCSTFISLFFQAIVVSYCVCPGNSQHFSQKSHLPRLQVFPNFFNHIPRLTVTQQVRYNFSEFFLLILNESDILHKTFHLLKCDFCFAYFAINLSHTSSIWCHDCQTNLLNEHGKVLQQLSYIFV